MLFTKGTKDEIYMYVSRSREQKMMAQLRSVNAKLEREAAIERRLNEGQHLLE